MKNTNSANNAHKAKSTKKQRLMQAVVIILIAAVVITYSISFIGYM